MLLINFLLYFLSCQQPKSDLENVLQKAGKNRGELEKVLNYYASDNADSLKYKAACFLIENMEEKYTKNRYCNQKYLTFISEWENVMKNDLYDARKQFDSLLISEKPIVNQGIFFDIDHITADYLINNIELAFDAWEKPWAKNVEFDVFCEEILPYRIFNEPLENWRSLVLEDFRGLTDSLIKIPNVTPLEVCKAVCNIINEDWPMYMGSDKIKFNYTAISKTRIGTCTERAMLPVYILRALGIPVVIDAANIWGGIEMPRVIIGML